MADSKANPELNPGDQPKSKIGITEDLVDAAADRIPDDLAPYNDEVMGRMSSEQNGLFRVFVSSTAVRAGLFDTKRREAFRFGGALVYDALPEAVRSLPLTGQQLETAQISVVDLSPIDKKGEVDVKWFMNKLQDDESLLLGLLSEAAGVLFRNDYKAAGEFLLGAMLVVMPFYMRAEAGEMEQRLYGGGAEV